MNFKTKGAVLLLSRGSHTLEPTDALRKPKALRYPAIMFLLVVAGILGPVSSEDFEGGAFPGHPSGKLPEIVATRSLLVHGGLVVNADRQELADVYIEDGIIVAVGLNLSYPAHTVKLNATGKLVIPGGIDPHVHLEMPFMGMVSADDYFTGTRAALAGGTTTVIDFAMPLKGETPLQTVERYMKLGAKAVSDWSIHLAVTAWDDTIHDELETVAREKGVTSMKMFMAYKGALQVSDDQLYAAMRRAAVLGMVPMVHAENGDLIAAEQKRLIAAGVTGPEGHPQSRPAEFEGEATHRATVIAAAAGSPLYVVHVMSRDAMDAVKRAKLKGQRVIGEALVAGLTLNDTRYYVADWLKAAKYVLSPPLRPVGHSDALLAALAAGVLTVVGTDHCAFNSTQKKAGLHDFTKIPNGVTGIEDRMAVLWHRAVVNGPLSASEYVAVTSTNAAKAFGLYPRKGIIAVGSDADVVVFDPARTHVISVATQFQNLDTNVYDGWNVTGTVVATVANGRIVYADGKIAVERCAGRFLKRQPFTSSLYPRGASTDFLGAPRMVNRA